jgi:hypothetical protein
MIELKEMEEEEKPKRGYRSRRNKLLDALEAIYGSGESNVQEKIQAAQLASKVIESTPKPQRKTDKEKAQIAALKTITPKKKGTS